MCSFTGLGKSPDRLDALVWALTALAFQKTAAPRVGQV
jgi:phage terminase large subunit-like protein